jgi:nucleotide-binding universal stress UspA family protein
MGGIPDITGEIHAAVDYVGPVIRGGKGIHTFKRIIVPVDLTEKSLAAVDLARELAAEAAAEVILLHVIETIEHVQFDELKGFYERLELSAQKRLETLGESLRARNINVDQAIIYGHRTKEIVNYASAKNADLIVIASHRIDPQQPGHDWSSISYAVAILSPIPVLLIK